MPVLIIFILFRPYYLLTRDILNENGDFISESFGIKFKKPMEELSFSVEPAILNIPGAMVEYFERNKRISFLIAGYKTRDSVYKVGEALRYHFSQYAINIQILENNIWLLKKNANVLFQRYVGFIKNFMFYFNIYILVHREDRERKVCLIVSSPYEYFSGLMKSGQRAYDNLNFYR